MILVDQTKKFKTVLITLKFKAKASKETFALRTLLPSMLRAKTNQYKSRSELNLKLEQLYGANLQTQTSKMGVFNIITVQLKITNPAIVKDQSLFEDALSFLNEVIYGHDNFYQKDLDLEKRLLIEEIRAKENDKTRHALSRLTDIMFENELYGYRTSGTKEDVNAVNLKDFKEYYKNEFLVKDELQVILSGDITNEEVLFVKQNFKQAVFTHEDVLDLESKEINEVKSIVEFDQIQQSKLNIGYRSEIRYNDPLYTATVLFNAALGGYVHSRLFLNVREKHSLCYYISSIYDAYKGTHFIYSGVDKNRLELAKQVIDEEVQKMSTILISEKELELSKQALINDLKEAEDSQGARLNRKYNQLLLNVDKTIDEQIQTILAIKPNDLLEVGKRLKKDTVFVLDVENK
ncbi:predicted metalloenzyme, LuxS/M16 peptidase-like, metal-binding [Paracholeplasma brassicae]|jgi:predicted Zn-dependent peptidase|uniref:Predicted metalloenzyme, LuxS/M16 peptidase-like, metal-binding n=1 Tax=Acholeplasma brassicae TaxID=61635 RepID=U4KNG6_9MOLU|nr:pitrilysin family protein [Paracholeplasma brassicae]CCV65796.1 predicted metalloenzyme, LuxS/M16 peptidase-like, metal-binding [Paracholeplasma brassicae]HBT59797.1 insulinase family protein [Acholeplasmataceae bacterium]